MMHTKSSRALLIAAALTLSCSARAQVQLTVSDDFTQAAAQNNWATFDGACLTAGDGSGTIPKCGGLTYYQGQTLVGGTTGTLPDAVGSGALRLTNGFTAGTSGFMGGFNQAGGIISNFTFAAGTGVQILFKTVTYRGNSGGNGGGDGVDRGDGADGISFFLIDAATNGVNGGRPYDMGAFGGSLGYTCSNTNNDPTVRPDNTPRQYDGLLSGYMGLGIDEFGNFLNPRDNTASGPGLQAGRIGLRGAGSISWKALNTKYPQYYPSSLTRGQQAEAVNKTCKTGTLWDYSNPAQSKQLSTTIPDYKDLNAYQILPDTQPIANEAALTRGAATPIAYQLKITQDGLLSLSYSYNNGAYLPVITDQDITTNGTLPGLLRFGFAGSTGGSTNVHEILCFQANPTQLADTSVGVNQKEATQIGSGTQAFLALYYPNGWWSRLTASNLLLLPSTKQIVVSATANWDASCVLTGVASPATCVTTGATNMTAQGSANRTMLTWNGTQGVPFKWTQLSDPQRAALDPGVSSAGTPNRLNYLRGDRTNEVNSSGVGMYRARISVLGDIVDGSPAWVGAPVNPYTAVWKDRLYPNNPAAENSAMYSQYITNKQGRTNVVYVGSNDGFVHGFRAGAMDSSGSLVTSTPNDGRELLAYMPGTVVSSIHNNDVPSVDYSSTRYGHVFFVDAPPAADDLYYGGAWHTWLVGGLGPGGKAIYALDVTDPSQFNESNAASLVIGEWTPNNLTCASANCGRNLGNTYGVPVIRRLHNGSWGVIFGNGFGSTSGDAGIFIMTVSSGGAKAFYYLSAGQSGKNDGIASPAPADFDGDHITDYVYAGDLLGNVWRFDLTSSDPTKWAASSTPLFTEPSGAAITTKLTVGSGPVQGSTRAMIDFGTGMKTPLTNASAATYSTGAHRLYGIWDWNMGAWNSKSTARFASLPTVTVTAPSAAIGLGTLQEQTLSVNDQGDLDATDNPVCWADQTSCTTTPKYGWYITLQNSLEQVIFNPVIYQDVFLVNTVVPAANSPFSCKNTGDTGYTIAVSLATGGAISGLFPQYGDTHAVGSLTNGSGSPFIILAGGDSYMLTQTVGGGSANGPISCPPGSLVCSAPIKPHGPVGKRLTWIQRR